MAKEQFFLLSQDELDKLLGTKTPVSPIIPPKQESTTPKFECTPFATEEQMQRVAKIFTSGTRKIQSEVRKKFSGPKKRKISFLSAEQVCQADFFSAINSNDFIYRLTIQNCECFLKLDSFLFYALAGLSFSINHKTNRFQDESLKSVIVPIFTTSLLKVVKQFPSNLEIYTESLYKTDLTPLKTEKAGICANLQWNESFKSLGIEKIFISEEFFRFILSLIG